MQWRRACLGGGVGLELTRSHVCVGGQAADTSVGTVLSGDKNDVAKGKWWLVVFPSMAMCRSVIGVNFMGDGLRDALDPKQNRMRA